MLNGSSVPREILVSDSRPDYLSVYSIIYNKKTSRFPKSSFSLFSHHTCVLVFARSYAILYPDFARLNRKARAPYPLAYGLI